MYLFDYEYLSGEQLAGFDNYKYSSIDSSPLSVYVMHPFWNKVVEYVPKWVAPNLLTFVGSVFIVLNFISLTYYDYDFYASSAELPTGFSRIPVVPNWCWLAICISVFLAYTLDGIDGKQARRTKTSGPLGELFDHGLDSLTVFFVPVCLYSCFGRFDYSITTVRFYFVLWNVLLSFYASHWEKYNTGVLFLPWGYDLSMWSSCLVFFATGLLGHDMWKITLYRGLTAGNMFEITIHSTALVANLPVSFYNIYLHRSSSDSVVVKTDNHSRLFRPLAPMAVLCACTLYWFAVSSKNDLLIVAPRMVYLLTGIVFSNVTCRLIVSQMSSSRCDVVNALVVMLCLSAVLARCYPSLEMSLLYVCCTIAILAHLHYGTCIVRQMSRHFKRDTFKVSNQED